MFASNKIALFRCGLVYFTLYFPFFVCSFLPFHFCWYKSTRPGANRRDRGLLGDSAELVVVVVVVVVIAVAVVVVVVVVVVVEVEHGEQ